MNIDILKNPIVIGVFVATSTYLYMWYSENKRMVKNPKTKKKPVNVITPLVIGVITWFIASSYLKNQDSTQVSATPIKTQVPTLAGGMNGKLKHHIVTAKGSIHSDGTLGSASYHVIGKNNIRLPPTDVFIDLAKF